MTVEQLYSIAASVCKVFWRTTNIVKSLRKIYFSTQACELKHVTKAKGVRQDYK